MYKVDIKSGRIFDPEGVEVPLDDRADAYHAYLLWLSADRAPEPFDAPPAPPSPAEELAAARAWGVSVVDAFMTEALAAGVNDAGQAGPLFGWLAGVSAALSSGALHAAEQLLGELLKTPEGLRPARPYSDDAALVPIHELLREQLALPTKGER